MLTSNVDTRQFDVSNKHHKYFEENFATMPKPHNAKLIRIPSNEKQEDLLEDNIIIMQNLIDFSTSNLKR